MSSKEKILTFIKSENSPLSKILKFNENGNKIINFEGIEKTVLGEKNVQMEEIAREVLMQTFLKNENKNYTTENTYNGQYRADLTAKINDNDIASIIEVKYSNSDIKEEKFSHISTSAFNQVLSLYSNDQVKIKNDCFVSVVILDVEKIAHGNDFLTKYFNLSLKEKQNSYEVFKKYGVYIETKIYNYIQKSLSEISAFSLTRIAKFSIEKQQILGVGEVSKIYSKISDAINLPTNSPNSYGIKNVRNIKDPNIDGEKRELIMDIISTISDAFNKRDSGIITNAGLNKIFLYAKNESIGYSSKYGESETLSICTLNGAIIDGQNSLDAFKWVIDTLQKKLNGENLNYIEEKIWKKITELVGGNQNHNQIKELLDFILNTKISIELSQVENAKDAVTVAISKNNTTPVSKSELVVSNIHIMVQILANELLENYGINVIFPKKEIFLPSENIKDKSIGIIEIAKYLSIIDKMKSNKEKNVLKIVQTLYGNATPDFNVVKNYINKSKSTTIETDKINDQLKLVNAMLKEKKSMLQILSSLPHSDDIEGKISLVNEEIDECKSSVKKLNNKLTNSNEISYKTQNIDSLANIIERIFLIQKEVSLLYNEDKNKELIKDIKSFISSAEKFSGYIFALSVEVIKRKGDFTKEDIENIFYCLINNVKKIIDEFDTSITILRNNTSEDSHKVLRKDGTTCSLKEARDVFFAI